MCEANTNLEAELVETGKRQIMSPAKSLKNTLLCNSNQCALTVAFHFLFSLGGVSV